MEPIFKCLHICFMKLKSSKSDSVPSIYAGGTDRSFVSHIKSIYAYYIHGIYAIHSLKLSCMHIRGCQILVGVNATILLSSFFQSSLFFYFEAPIGRKTCVFQASFKYTFPFLSQLSALQIREGHCALNRLLRGHFLGIKMLQ